jgi:hypothetical protein
MRQTALFLPRPEVAPSFLVWSSRETAGGNANLELELKATWEEYRLPVVARRRR